MALPVSPAPKSDDIAVRGWAGLTVIITWTLLLHGVKSKPSVVREAREHVLYHLDPTASLQNAEDRAAWLTGRLVARARAKKPVDPWPHDIEMPMSDRWRAALTNALDPVARHVFLKHYGDNRSLAAIAKQHNADPVTLEGAQAGLREVIRKLAIADQLPLHDWPAERLDRLLTRLASWAPDGCPDPRDIVGGAHDEHVRSCARCGRMARLVRNDVLGVDDLLPPTFKARQTARVTVLALQLHPDARRYRRALIDELQAPASALATSSASSPIGAHPLGDDLLLVDLADRERVLRVLTIAAELGEPRREQLRGAVLEGDGRFGLHGLLGPLAERAEGDLNTRPWGQLDGLGALPDAMPAPPSATNLWRVAAMLALMLVSSAVLAWKPASASHAYDVHANFAAGRGGVWVQFDTAEATLVTIIREQAGQLHVMSEPHSPADKVSLAIGDGQYRLHAPGDGVLVIGSGAPIADLDSLIAEAGRSNAPLARLEAIVALAAPRATVQRYPL